MDLSPVERHIIELRREHMNTWRDRKNAYWMRRLLQEVEELGLALIGMHKHSPSYELYQIASICINWAEGIAMGEIK